MEVSDEPKMQLAVGLIAGLPQGDFDQLNAETSPGININFGYTVIPHVSIMLGLRYFAVQSPDLEDAGIDFSNYDFDVGGRYTMPISPTAKVFGEAMLIYSTVAASGGGMSDSESDIGFGARGGVMFGVSGKISLGAAASYTTATINDAEAAWLGLEGFASFGF